LFDLTLTFDNGPTEATPAVLDLLAAHGVKSTFFVLGRQLADPSLRAHAERAHAEGHWIGNHTYSHTRALGEFDDLDASVRELADTDALIDDLAPGERLFRPYANGAHLDRRVLNPRAVAYLARHAFTVVLWNTVPRDWERSDWVEVALSQVALQPWSLMVLHDRFGRVLPGLETFLPRVVAAGARFRQDFPPECLPMKRGIAEPSLEPLINRDR
jgi:peptidoglycan/xylan/chitin deacetylase (PgdA/CDA1 family)